MYVRIVCTFYSGVLPSCRIRHLKQRFTIVNPPANNLYAVLDATMVSTVEPLLKDTLNKGHHSNYLPTKDTF